MHASVKELKDHLSSYVNRIQHGEELIITLHKKPIAKLIPFTSPEANTQLKHKKLLGELAELHEKLQKTSLKKSMRETVIKMRQQERF